MSVNITVNGKFVANHCQKNSLLLDPVTAKKEQMEERRKVRLLQVREQSKKFAEKIRNDVKESKRKGLQKYEATKAEEFNAWRKQALQKNNKECCEALFQIGTAHMAAKAENKAQAEKQAKQGSGSYKDFRKQMAARRRNKDIFPKQGPCICSKIHVCPSTQFECKCFQNQKEAEEPHKRKRDCSFISSDSESEKCDDDTSNDDTLKEDTSSSCSVTPYKSATTTSSSNNMATQTSLICPGNNLRKTPAVYLDVEVGSDDSVLITAPVEIKDKHAEYNRQFSSVIRVSPRKVRHKQETKADHKQTQATCTSIISSVESSRERTQEEANIHTETNARVIHQPAAKAVREKRFTLISDLVRKQQDQPKHFQQTSPNKRPTPDANHHMSPRKFKAMPAPTSRPPVSRPVSQPITSPPVSPPRKASISSKSSKVISGGHTHPTSISAASANAVAMGSTSSSSCRVQFYDYNSKLTKDGVQTQTNVRVNRQRDSVQPSAMDQASVENRLLYDRQQDMVNKNKQMEERGQKALEREQVRRDCNELTEKLEALTRQYPRQMPINENPPHIFVDKQLRKEGKMNSAVEKLLSRPNIITCSEMKQKETMLEDNNPKQPVSANNLFNEVNVGASPNLHLPADDVSSDSCCSILLGYVDDQSRQVRKDLEQWPDKENSQKQKRLQNLLQRLDQLRNSLIQELKTDKGNKVEKPKASAKEEHYLQLIDDITTYRQERENIMIDDIVQQKNHKEEDKRPTKEVRDKRNEKSSANKQTQKKDTNPLDEREKVLQQKEAILEEKLREFYDLQKQQHKTQKPSKTTESASDEPTESRDVDESEHSENKENINCTAMETPVEIVITIQGETKCIKIPGKNKRKMTPRKNPTQLATLIRSPQLKNAAKKATPKKKLPVSKENPGKGVLGRHNSYDSNSTSYMSLPPQMPTQLGNLVDNKQQQTYDNSSTEDAQTSVELDNDESHGHNFKKPVPHLNPLVAQYIQRLLGMSRKAIHRLGVSSSDIDSPSSTLINTSGNNTASSDSMVSDERLACVESFVQENRSFIKELEQSLRAQNNTSLENSMRTLDEIWRKRLKPQQKATKSVEQMPKSKHIKPQHKENKCKVQSPRSTKGSPTRERSQRNVQKSKDVVSQTKRALNPEKPSTSKSSATLSKKNVTKPCRPDDFESSPEMLRNFNKPTHNRPDHRRPSDKVDKSVETRMSSQELDKTEPDNQIARYAQLTENCTHRIAELTELINRVREEKQRLLEVTLSSVSDNGRQSTEYLELPGGKSCNTNEAESSLVSSTDDASQHKPTSSMDMVRQIPKLSALEKNRHITASQDSGIADSRPITAQENRTDAEPMSHTSTESQNTVHQRKLKPPPTLRRFSPQFQEDELVHELSTILEVDTPANSRINTAVGQTSEDRLAASVETPRHAVIMFPTFEEYVQRMNLDITQLDTEQSIQLQQEFTHFIEDLQRSQTKRNPQYSEFPSINGYVNQSKSDLADPAEAMEDSLAQLRLSGLQPSRFPAVREYVQRNKTNATSSPGDDQQLLDTESLENITDMATNTNTENESASLDIEKELKDRKILKNSFRYTKTKQIFSSTAHQDGGEFYNEIMAGESGVEKLSTSDNTMAILETDLKRMVHQWPADGRKKNRQQQAQYQALSSTTTSSYQSKQDKQLKSTSLDDSSNEIGRPLNLRDFLTRELLKHANFSASTTTSTSSSDDSLRSQFLHSLIGSLTPRTNAATSKSGQHTLDRQKTSTPVPIQSSQTHSTPSNNVTNFSSSQLFSGESRLSSVHGYDRSAARLQTSDGVNADQSSE